MSLPARILFVDDEALVLQGLRRTLFALNVPWEVDYATDGASALAKLQDAPYDAVVTDMNMEPMDGAELLRRVREQQPATLRFVLSGHVEGDAAVRALQVAQQLLAKPCDGRMLVDAVDAGIAVQRRLADPVVHNLLGRIKTLPAAPRVHAEVTAALAHPRCDARRVAGILARDPAIAANVLHLANSAYFNGNGRSAANLDQAVTRVGLATIADLVLATEVFAPNLYGAAAERLRNRSLVASRLAARMAAGKPEASMASTAALLADIAYLLPGIDQVRAGPSLSAFAHAEIGAALLALWSLPLPIVEAVAYHHTPAQLPRQDFGLRGIVHLASAIANDWEPDLDFIAAHHMTDQFAYWKAANEQEAGRAEHG